MAVDDRRQVSADPNSENDSLSIYSSLLSSAAQCQAILVAF